MSNRLIGLDIGDVRIGVSISDDNNRFALPLEVIDRRKTKAIYRIKDLLREYEINTLIVGLPRKLNGNYEIQVEKIKNFVLKLEQKIKGIKVVYYDERYTTKLAETYLKTTKKNTKEIRKVVDMMAANIILQGYIDKHKGE